MGASTVSLYPQHTLTLFGESVIKWNTAFPTISTQSRRLQHAAAGDGRAGQLEARATLLPTPLLPWGHHNLGAPVIRSYHCPWETLGWTCKVIGSMRSCYRAGVGEGEGKASLTMLFSSLKYENQQRK